MKQTIGFYEFSQAFEAIRPSNFSHEGLSTLFDYLEQFEADTGEELELDVIAICCDFSEDSAVAIANMYRIDLDEAEGNVERISDIVREYLQDEGAYVGDSYEDESGLVTFVYRSF